MIQSKTELATYGLRSPEQGAAQQRPWRIYRNRSGAPRWYQRYLEAWWIVTGKWSLHRAWQAGKDQGGIDEYRRVIINGGDLIPIMNATIFATRAEMPKGSMLSAADMLDIRRKAWVRYTKGAASMTS